MAAASATFGSTAASFGAFDLASPAGAEVAGLASLFGVVSGVAGEGASFGLASPGAAGAVLPSSLDYF